MFREIFSQDLFLLSYLRYMKKNKTVLVLEVKPGSVIIITVTLFTRKIFSIFGSPFQKLYIINNSLFGILAISSWVVSSSNFSTLHFSNLCVYFPNTTCALIVTTQTVVWPLCKHDSQQSMKHSSFLVSSQQGHKPFACMTRKLVSSFVLFCDHQNAYI